MPAAPAAPAQVDPARFHLFWDAGLAGFKSSHIGLDRTDQRRIRRTTPVETVEWLLPGWRVLTRLTSATTLTWRDNPNTTWAFTGGEAPPRQQGCREHMLLARDTTPFTSAEPAEPSSTSVSTSVSVSPNNSADWMLFSLPTTAAAPFFRAWGNPPIRSWNFKTWEPHERAWAVQFALRTAIPAPTPLALANSLCLMLEDPPDADDQSWWPVPDLITTLAMALANKSGSGNHPSGASRKAALAQHADTLHTTRTMLALGAVRDWDAIANT